MSVSSYILQSCDGSQRYRINFTNGTYLGVGETWNVECGGIQNGCYQVLENTNEVLDEFYGDDCTFTEYEDCDECNTNIIVIDEPTAVEACYQYEKCNTRDQFIYVPTGATLPDVVVLYNNVCYIQYTSSIGFIEPTDLSTATYYDKCSTCEAAITVSNSPTPTVTPTITPTVTTTPTVTPTLTVTPTVSTSTPIVYEYRQVRLCCPDYNNSANFTVVNIRFIEGEAPNVGDVIHFASFVSSGPSCGTVISDNYAAGSIQDFGWTAHTSCYDCLSSNDYRCTTQFFRGCETDTIYTLFSIADNYIVGEVNDVSGLTATNIASGTLYDTCIEAITGVSTSDELVIADDFSFTAYTNCAECLDLCNPQDFVVLMDQSGSVGSANWSLMREGVVNIANNLESRMDTSEVRMGAIKWSSCANTSQIQSLTSNHDTFTGSVINAIYQGGGTYASQALEDAYTMLSADNLSAEKSIIILTDGYIADFSNENYTCNTLTTSQLATQMKMGTYGSGVQIKIYTVNIANGNSSQLNSLSSGEGFHFEAANFLDFVSNISEQITDNTCDANPIPSGVTYDYYQCSPCCGSYGLSDIIVSVDTGTTINLTTDGFSYLDTCYTFESLTGDSYSGQTVYTVLSGDVITNACSQTECNCSSFGSYDLVNCCDSNDVITILYSGTPTTNAGIEFAGNCYSYKGDSGTETPIGTFSSLVVDICSEEDCECTATSPSVTPTLTTTPTVTPTVTNTPDSSSTPSQTVTPTLTTTPTVTPTVTNTPDSSSTPSQTVTPTLTTTPTVTPTVTNTPGGSSTPSQTVTPTLSTTPTITPTDAVSSTPTPTISVTPSVSNPHTCYIGTTNGVYRYVDCCGILRWGESIGQQVCFDPQETYTGVILSSSECTLECDNGPMSYTFTVTGTCDDPNGGRIIIYPDGGTLPYTIDNNLPGSLGSETGIGPFVYSGLSADTYTFTMNDSSGGSNQEVNININVEGCLTITGWTENELCKGGNGSFTVSGDSLSVPYTVYLYKNTFLHLSGNSLYNTYTWNGLSYGDYYAVVEDYGGATAQTATYTITSGVSVDYGFSITGQSPCFQIGGAAEVTGVTGNSPFTYLWNNGQTGTTATGLTQGYNSVTVTDVSGCTTTKNVFIPYVSQLGVQSITTTQSTCFNQDGTATVTVTGGTAPYYFSGSTGQSSGYISSNSYTLTGLSGSQSVRIIDSGYCDITEYFTVPTTAGFTVVEVNSTNSQCSNDGTITIQVNGTTGNITYSITGSTGNTQTVTSLSQSHTFTNLVSDTYVVGITSDSGCEYTTTKTIENEEKFIVSYTGTNASCGVNNGSVYIEVSSGTTELMYPLSYIIKRVSDGTTIYNNINSTSSTQTVTNLLDGTYEIIVTDNNSCSVTEYFTLVQDGDGIEAILYGTPCVFGNDGTATLQITNGTAPFSISWSSNVPSSQSSSMFLSGLSGGTYTVTIFDSNGCALQRRVTIQCDTENIDNYVINTLCEQTFTTTTQRKRGFHEMLNESYLDLNLPGYDCFLESAIFRGVLTMSGGSYGGGYTYEDEFYTGYTLNDVPSDNEWETVVDGLFSNFTGITYSVDIIDNTFTVNGICDGDEDPTNGAFVELKLEIDIEVNCENRVAPTPSVTPSITPTISVTPSITPTISVTPSITPTISITPSPGASTTPSVTPSITTSVTPTPSLTLTPTPSTSVPETPKALLFILEQKNNTAFAQYMYDSGSTFYGFAYNSQPSTGFDITTFMDWPGWFNGTAPTVIEQDIPQVTGGVDEYGNGITQYNFLTTKVPKGTASSAWYIWLIPQSQIGDSGNRQTHIQYNVNSIPAVFITQPMTSNIYEIAANYTGVNWVNDTYRMYTTHPGQAFSITNNDTDDIFFKGGLIS